jgi:aryl-alcohol dehydrogenase-like predicted oxidoreductase
MKLALGTVQFGMPYGVANTGGQVESNQVIKILKLASKCGVTTLDTAIGYGESESCLGTAGIEGWRIITKLPEIPSDSGNVPDWIENQFRMSLNRLKVDRIAGLMLHRPQQLLEPKGGQVWAKLKALKSSGQVERIGYSIYDPKELDRLWERYKPDIIQAPYSIFDQRLKTCGWLQKLRDNEVEVHVRSVFLQGLLLMEREQRPEKFKRWDETWDLWESWLKENNLTALQACISWVKFEENIDCFVAGVDSEEQLKQILAVTKDVKKAISPSNFSFDDELINPSKW